MITSREIGIMYIVLGLSIIFYSVVIYGLVELIKFII